MEWEAKDKIQKMTPKMTPKVTPKMTPKMTTWDNLRIPIEHYTFEPIQSLQEAWASAKQGVEWGWNTESSWAFDLWAFGPKLANSRFGRVPNFKVADGWMKIAMRVSRWWKLDCFSPSFEDNHEIKHLSVFSTTNWKEIFIPSFPSFKFQTGRWWMVDEKTQWRPLDDEISIVSF